MRRFVKVTVAALAIVGAQASVADGPLQKTVGYAELDLSQARGIETLHRRLSNAAEQVCSPLDAKRARTVVAYRQCVSKALADAVAQVNRPLLTQYHEARHGDDLPRLAAR